MSGLASRKTRKANVSQLVIWPDVAALTDGLNLTIHWHCSLNDIIISLLSHYNVVYVLMNSNTYKAVN